MHKIIPQNKINIFFNFNEIVYIKLYSAIKKIRTSDKVQELENEDYKKFEAADTYIKKDCFKSCFVA